MFFKKLLIIRTLEAFVIRENEYYNKHSSILNHYQIYWKKIKKKEAVWINIYIKICIECNKSFY